MAPYYITQICQDSGGCVGLVFQGAIASAALSSSPSQVLCSLPIASASPVFFAYRKCFAFPCKAGGGFGPKMKGGGKGRKGAFECLKPPVTRQGQVRA
jgi:hypothetical protein